ncbi:14612_t:CDS:2, partial [Dentiscutata heterogama]
AKGRKSNRDKQSKEEGRKNQIRKEYFLAKRPNVALGGRSKNSGDFESSPLVEGVKDEKIRSSKISKTDDADGTYMVGHCDKNVKEPKGMGVDNDEETAFE